MVHDLRFAGACLSVLLCCVLLLCGCQKSGESDLAWEADAVEAVTTGVTDTVTIRTTVPTEEDTAWMKGLLDGLQITMPEGIERQRVSDGQDRFSRDGKLAGGVCLLNIDQAIFDDALNYGSFLETEVKAAMTELGLQEPEWISGGSSNYGIYEFNMGNVGAEYMAYVIRGRSACYLVWFDRNVITADLEKAMMESLSSEDISQELNRISNEEYMEALNAAMEGKEYVLEMTLPEGITREDTSDTSARLYRDGQVVGGYQTVHFEEGVLPQAQENREQILSYLEQNVMSQIDDAEMSGEIVDEELITVVFSNETKEYTHYILYYGQLGTQYDLWFDTSLLEEETAQQILWTAQLRGEE